MSKNTSGNIGKSFMHGKNKYLILGGLFILILLIVFFLPALIGLDIYTSGFEGPSAQFTSINNLMADNSQVVSGGGTLNAVNPYDGTTWNIGYQVGGTTININPVDSTGNEHTALIGEMSNPGFPNGQATPPTETYSWTTTNSANGVSQQYEMDLYPLTWTLNFATSTRNYEHIYYYVGNTVTMTVSLNQNMWYFSTTPSNVYFGVAAIQLINFTAETVKNGKLVTGNLANVKYAMIPSALNDLLAINSPTNGESAANAFYSYEGAELNPEMFAPSVTTSVTIADLAPTSSQGWNGVWGGSDVSVHMVFTVWTMVVGDWTVKPTFKGTAGTITPGHSTTPVIGDPLSALENALLANPLASLIILAIVFVVVAVVLFFAFPEVLGLINKGAKKAGNIRIPRPKRGKRTSKKKG
jgi:hypothetical protein